MIKINKISKTYELEGNKFCALDNISLNITAGEFVVVLGQSGCGKSTLLNILGGMDVPTSGSVIVGKHELSKSNQDKLAKYRREDVGMVFQKFNLISDATVLENIKLPLKFSGKSNEEQTRIAKEAIEKVGLTEKIKSLPKKLSGGQQQRVAIARSLVNNPKILLCDEPTGNLDSKTGEEIINLLKKLNEQGITIIMVTHNENYCKFASRTIKMLDGRIILDEKKKTGAKTSLVEDQKTGSIGNIAKISLAAKNLGRRKLRFFLTSFGIAIGAMAMVILVSFGAGLKLEVLNQLESASQVEEITVTGEKTDEFNFSGGVDFAKKSKKEVNDTTISDLKNIDGVEEVFPSISINGEMIYGDKISIVYGESVPPLKYIKSKNKEKIGFGKYFESDDENSVIIPYGQAVALGFENPETMIGKEVTIKTKADIRFNTKVVGIFGKDEKYAYSTLIPNKTAISWLKQIKTDELSKSTPDIYPSLTVRAADTSKVSSIKKTVDERGFGAQSYEDIANQMSRIFNIMQIVMGVVGGIALLVASLGIVNTMIMSVLERTREIGIMKAVGARNRDIRSIFLTEASFIGLFGGLVGLSLGFLGSRLIQTVINSYLTSKSASSSSESLTFYIPSYLSVGVVVFSIIVAAVAGYFPARRAAKLDPAEALREE